MTTHRIFYWLTTALFLAVNSIFVIFVWRAEAEFHRQQIQQIYPLIKMGFPYPASTPSFDVSCFVVMLTSLLMIGMWFYEIRQHDDKCRRSFTFFVIGTNLFALLTVCGTVGFVPFSPSITYSQLFIAITNILFAVSFKSLDKLRKAESIGGNRRNIRTLFRFTLVTIFLANNLVVSFLVAGLALDQRSEMIYRDDGEFHSQKRNDVFDYEQRGEAKFASPASPLIDYENVRVIRYSLSKHFSEIELYALLVGISLVNVVAFRRFHLPVHEKLNLLKYFIGLILNLLWLPIGIKFVTYYVKHMMEHPHASRFGYSLEYIGFSDDFYLLGAIFYSINLACFVCIGFNRSLFQPLNQIEFQKTRLVES